VPPPQDSGKIFFGQLLRKIRVFFSGKNHVKFGNFVNLSGNKNSGILLFFREFSGKNNVKFGHIVNFSNIVLGQRCRSP